MVSLLVDLQSKFCLRLKSSIIIFGMEGHEGAAAGHGRAAEVKVSTYFCSYCNARLTRETLLKVRLHFFNSLPYIVSISRFFYFHSFSS